MGISDHGIELEEEPMLAGPAVGTTLPKTADGWQMQQRARQLGRKLRVAPPSRPPQSGLRQDATVRLDPPQDFFDDVKYLTSAPLGPASFERPSRPAPSPKREFGQLVAWLFALAGVAVLGSGLGTIGYSLSMQRADLWELANGLTLAGQGLLIFGLLVIVTRLWRNSRHATGKLQVVHEELGQLQHTADALTAMRSGGSPAFYGELVRGASPQILLSNLKGQIDHLATRLGSEW